MKHVDFPSQSFACILLLCFLSTACGAVSVATAAEKPGSDDAEQAKVFLEDRGLRKVGNYFILPDENEVKRQLRETESLKRRLRDAQQESATCDEQVAGKQKLIVDYLQKRRVLRSQLTAARSARAHNNLVTMLNELGDRIRIMQADNRNEKAAQTARATLETLQCEYIDDILKIRILYDEVAKNYADLANDDEITQAIETFNKTNARKCQLGPQRSFNSLGIKLERIEETVIRESIDLGRGIGNLWTVPAVFNDGKMQIMAIDTGASIISLPWDVAAALGMAPTSNDLTMQVKMADGRVVTATQKTASKVRVGKFTVENVECAVMPQELTEAAPLLGLSFLKHFTFKIDTANAKLIMSKVEDMDASSRGRGRRNQR